MAKKRGPAPDLKLFEQADDGQKNRLLLDWLSDEDYRRELFQQVNKSGGRLAFPSRDATPRECDCEGVAAPRAPARSGHKQVWLVTDRQQVVDILCDPEAYSSRVYSELGGGSFMLALDPHHSPAHQDQRQVFDACFPQAAHVLAELAQQACQAASISTMRAPEFDMAAFAEQAALRYTQKLMGYGMVDYLLLESTLRQAYAGLVYQVLGRHFASDPTVIQRARQASAQLTQRSSELIDAYGRDDQDLLKACKDHALPAGFKPALQQLGEWRGGMNGEQRAVLAVGAAVGTVGNVQAAACHVLEGLFRSLNAARARGGLPGSAGSASSHSLWDEARAMARSESPDRPTQRAADWKRLIAPFLANSPPIPFLPRLAVDPSGHAVSQEPAEIVLALGGGAEPGQPDPLIWGLPPVPGAQGGCPVHTRKDKAADPVGPHWCAGMPLAWPLLVEIVRHAMALPGLAERLDPLDASVIGLKKRWGFACESYPMVHRRDERVVQSCLNVAMRLRPPVRDSADRVRGIIRAGGPRIEEALRSARHVHFAWFELIEADTVLVLHTVYDGPFDAYVQHFALKVGDLFDKLFECIEDPPPTPVDQFPNEFVALIQRHDRKPAAGYFFSAYPRSDVARIIRDEMARP